MLPYACDLVFLTEFLCHAGLLRLSVWLSFIRNSRAGFHGNMKGDGLLLGATLVIGKGEKPDIIYQHLSKEFGDHADPQTVLEAAKKI